MSDTGTIKVDGRIPSQIAAAETRHRGAEYKNGLTPDSLYRSDGRIWSVAAYDQGSRAPQRPADDLLEKLQYMNVSEVSEWIDDYLPRLYRHSQKARRVLLRTVAALLAWLTEFPGDSWDERWLSSALDTTPRGAPDALATTLDISRAEVTRALTALVETRVVRPSYSWLLTSTTYRRASSSRFLEASEPDMLQRLRELPAYARAPQLAQRNSETCLARILIRTGKKIAALSSEDVLGYADVVRTSGRHNKEHLTWELLVALGPLADEPPTLRAAWAASTNSRQHTVEGLVSRYGIPDSGVKNLLVDYLSELKPGMDYGSLEGLAYRLVRLFWGQVLEINPLQQDLRLSPKVAVAWREKLALTLDGKRRKDLSSTYFAVRALYRDLAEWSHDQPERWAIWVAPTPLPRLESRQISKLSKQGKSRMQDRTRKLTPLLPQFMESATRLRESSSRLLEAASNASHDETFEIDGIRYVRHDPKLRECVTERSLVWVRLADSSDAPSSPPGPGYISATRIENDGFWGWAIANVLKETGVRIEELLELTQLSLRHYVAPTSNTVVPLLHIVPSKTDAERLIPMSPELVKVLVEVQRRARGKDSSIPLSVRYDTNDRVFSDPLPHMFSRLTGTTQNVVSLQYVRKILTNIAVDAGLTDGPSPLTFTPHDFRRLFATEMVGAGLPLHIVSTLLGHLSLETTRGYTAVFPEQVIQAHHAFIERRRNERPSEEFRPATSDEWLEFEQHFLLRKVALGDCQRPYGTPCIHEHACVKCRFLKVDPAQLGRIETMTSNAEERLVEARQNVWLGEVSALEQDLLHLRKRRDEAKVARELPDALLSE